MTRLISYYGDDFTGSTDVMEALASHGVETVLFTRLPAPEEVQPFAKAQAIGLAGSSRSQSPEWMDAHLPDAFRWLKSQGARFCHYKVCSTFDSSPATGSIGRAAEIGAEIFSTRMIPLVVGAPPLKRYTFAGHLFAGYQGEVYRIDRHPVMARHPVTPMDEADLRLHLARQTKLPVALANASWPDDGIGLLDVFDAATQEEAGRRLLALPEGRFVIGSSGVEYALVSALAKAGQIAGTAHFPKVVAVPQTMVVSGSVSPTTERQIRHACANGFVSCPVSAVSLAQRSESAVSAAVDAARRVLGEGQSPIIHTALGAATDEGERLKSIANGRQNIGDGLGRILRTVAGDAKLRRVIIAGGDTSSHALHHLGIYALTTRLPLLATPGSPLCIGFSADPAFNGVEISMKGGQLGGEAHFVKLRDGTAA